MGSAKYPGEDAEWPKPGPASYALLFLLLLNTCEKNFTATFTLLEAAVDRPLDLELAASFSLLELVQLNCTALSSGKVVVNVALQVATLKSLSDGGSAS